MQTVGSILAIALLVWCVSLALSPANRAQLASLADAPPSAVASLLALSAATILVNGAIFWLAITPVRRLGLLGVVATNALATMLNYLPFKLSVASRVLVHVRRDRLPLATIGAWLIAAGSATIGPMGAIAIALALRGAHWQPAQTLALVAAMLGLWVVSTVLIMRAVGRAVARVSLPPAPDLGAQVATGRPSTQSGALASIARRLVWRMGRGIDDLVAMLSGWGVVGGLALLRAIDVLVQALRLRGAASMTGQELTLEQSASLSIASHISGVLSPVGMLGAREGAAMGTASVSGVASAEAIAPAVLLVTVSEIPVALALGLAAALFLRIDRLLRPAASASTNARARTPEEQRATSSAGPSTRFGGGAD